ncbi:MAG: hypothetical protein PVI78_08300 [Anaerolineales bacterium]|jgi:hypothetical protein
MRKWWSVCAGIVISLMAALALAGDASALAITTSSITFPEVTLDGTDQTVVGITNAWQADATGESGGWNVSVSSTDFDNGSGKIIAVSNFEIRLLDSNIVWVTGDDINLPVSSQTTYTALSGTALKIASAAISEGNGIYDMTPDFRLTVPAETWAGSYSATLTVSIVAGP